ncbi:hypothetical protein J11TS1_24340 [Oceanobacillus sp. J11TS1]|nr:hypothetical protein J11TS1_24340 [Oceanobacillus sp. J11TS1]
MIPFVIVQNDFTPVSYFLVKDLSLIFSKKLHKIKRGSKMYSEIQYRKEKEVQAIGWNEINWNKNRYTYMLFLR